MLALAGCGAGAGGGATTSSGGATTSSGDDEGAARAAFAEWYARMREGDIAASCRLMTGNGRRAMAVLGADCAGARGDRLTGPRPDLGPIGAANGIALVVTRHPAKGGFSAENFVAVLRHRQGTWLVDLPQPAPIPPSLRAPGVPPYLFESLPTGGIVGNGPLAAASRYVDSGVASGSLDREHVDTVATVGDVALAYLVAGSDVAGTATTPVPAGTPTDILVLTKRAGRWRVLPISLGYA